MNWTVGMAFAGATLAGMVLSGTKTPMGMTECVGYTKLEPNAHRDVRSWTTPVACDPNDGIAGLAKAVTRAPNSVQYDQGAFCSTSGGVGEPTLCSVVLGDGRAQCSVVTGGGGGGAMSKCSVGGGDVYYCSVEMGGSQWAKECSIFATSQFCSVTAGGTTDFNFCSVLGGNTTDVARCSVIAASGMCSVESGTVGKAQCSVMYNQPGDHSTCSTYGTHATCSVVAGSHDHKCTSDDAGACSVQAGGDACSVVGGGGLQEKGSNGGVWCYGADG